MEGTFAEQWPQSRRHRHAASACAAGRLKRTLSGDRRGGGICMGPVERMLSAEGSVRITARSYGVLIFVGGACRKFRIDPGLRGVLRLRSRFARDAAKACGLLFAGIAASTHGRDPIWYRQVVSPRRDKTIQPSAANSESPSWVSGRSPSARLPPFCGVRHDRSVRPSRQRSRAASGPPRRSRLSLLGSSFQAPVAAQADSDTPR